jgi:hypothetical protein
MLIKKLYPKNHNNIIDILKNDGNINEDINKILAIPE